MSKRKRLDGKRARFRRRLRVLSVFFVMGALLIVSRMYQLTIINGQEYAEKGNVQKCSDISSEAYRGPIVDRNGVTLATTVPASGVSRERPYAYDPAHARGLAPLLGREPAELDRILAKGGSSFVWLSRGVDVDSARAIRRLGIEGIGIHRSQRRSYPQGNVAAHLIGFTGTDGGLEGVEKAFDEEITGNPLTVHICTDVRGRVFLSRGDIPGVNQGATVHLSIDATLQSIAETELAKRVEETEAIGGVVVMLDPRNGDVLAMANSPSYDPNDFRKSGWAARRNRAVTDLFEPGSTMKPFVIAAAMDAGVISASDRFFCENGRMMVEGWRKPIRDHHPYGWLDVGEILKVSSNICSAKIGAKLGATTLYRYLKGFGFDRKNDLPILGEARGLVPPASQWRPIRLANVSFGQGISVNALQLASAFATLANGGVRMKPRVVSHVSDQNGSLLRFFPEQAEQRLLSREVAETVTRMIEAVVSDEGTAPQARIDGVRVAGKTGTAQKAGRNGYMPGKYIASFAGFLPADDPRVVIVVIIDEPHGSHYGGVVAAPVFKAVAEASLEYLDIPRALPQPHDLPPELFKITNPLPPEQVVTADASVGRIPDVHGMSLRAALRALDGCGCEIKTEGRGYVIAQEPKAGTSLDVSAEVSLKLSRRL